MLAAWRNFRSFPKARRRLFFEAAAALLRYRIGIRLRPVHRYLDEFQAVDGKAEGGLSQGQEALVAEITWAVASAAGHLPGQYVCLPRALCAMRLLVRRKIPCTFHLSATMNENSMKAHAWLSCGANIVTGEREAREYPELGAFSVGWSPEQAIAPPLQPTPMKAVPPGNQ